MVTPLLLPLLLLLFAENGYSCATSTPKQTSTSWTSRPTSTSKPKPKPKPGSGLKNLMNCPRYEHCRAPGMKEHQPVPPLFRLFLTVQTHLTFSRQFGPFSPFQHVPHFTSFVIRRLRIHLSFYRTQVNLGSDLWVRMSVRH